jgi:copper homeostasis protein (lipoprotein)
MNERYQGVIARHPLPLTGWARTADKLVLTDSKGEKLLSREGRKLEMLDREGNPIESQLNYTLQPVKASLPTTPMAMRGMYFYMADAATFTDCATGKRSRWRTMPSLSVIMPLRRRAARCCWWWRAFTLAEPG